MLNKLFSPKSVAIIGASTKELSIGNRIIKSLLDFNYRGVIYPVNPNADTVLGIKSYNTIADISESVDLAHIVIPRAYVPGAIDDCATKKVSVVIINSAGFSETDKEGERLEEILIEKAKKYNMRILGPNCQGIINTDPESNAYCNFTFTKPMPGNISIFSQSGGVGEILMQRFTELDIGMRMYASNGNACDISITDIVSFWDNDEKTKAIVIYLENLTHPQEFYQVLKEAAKHKPILAIKGGRTNEGAKAVSSHSGGLAQREVATELILKKAGVLIFTDEEELCQAALAFSTQPIPKGNRVGLITNTGGPAIIAIDKLVESGLSIPSLCDNAISLLTGHLLEASSIKNPLDVLATANADHFRMAMETLIKEDYIDSLYINFVTPFFVDTEAIAHQIVAISDKKEKPVICNLMTDKLECSQTLEILRAGNVPCYSFPEMGAQVISALYRYYNLQNKKQELPGKYPLVNKDEAGKIISQAQNRGALMLSTEEACMVLSAYKIPLTSWKYVESAKDAADAAEKIGFPVVVKVESEEIVHKSDVDGVALSIMDAETVMEIVQSMKDRIKTTKPLHFFVQKYIPKGLELIIGAKKEGHLGHVILFGLGGIFTEILKDISFQIAPVTNIEAHEMIASIKSAPLLSGYRGKYAVNKEQISDIIQKCSKLVTDFPCIRELDLNPIKASEDSLCVVDVHIRINA